MASLYLQWCFVRPYGIDPVRYCFDETNLSLALHGFETE